MSAFAVYDQSSDAILLRVTDFERLETASGDGPLLWYQDAMGRFTGCIISPVRDYRRLITDGVIDLEKLIEELSLRFPEYHDKISVLRDAIAALEKTKVKVSADRPAVV